MLYLSERLNGEKLVCPKGPSYKSSECELESCMLAPGPTLLIPFVFSLPLVVNTQMYKAISSLGCM